MIMALQTDTGSLHLRDRNLPPISISCLPTIPQRTHRVIDMKGLPDQQQQATIGIVQTDRSWMKNTGSPREEMPHARASSRLYMGQVGSDGRSDMAVLTNEPPVPYLPHLKDRPPCSARNPRLHHLVPLVNTPAHPM